MKLKVKVIYAVLKDRQELSLSLSWEDNPHYTNWLYDFFGNTGSSVSLAQFFLTFWQGNSGDKLLECKTRETEQYYQIEKVFCQPNGVTAQSDSKAFESVRRDGNSISGGSDGIVMLWPVYLGSSSSHQAVRIKTQGQKWGKDSHYNITGIAQDQVATAAILGGETGSIPRAEVIISFVGGSHGTFDPYCHVSFVKEVYPDNSFLVCR